MDSGSLTLENNQKIVQLQYRIKNPLKTIYNNIVRPPPKASGVCSPGRAFYVILRTPGVSAEIRTRDLDFRSLALWQLARGAFQASQVST